MINLGQFFACLAAGKQKEHGLCGNDAPTRMVVWLVPFFVCTVMTVMTVTKAIPAPAVDFRCSSVAPGRPSVAGLLSAAFELLDRNSW